MVLEIVNQHQDELAHALAKALQPRAVGMQPTFDSQLPPAATLCWLPATLAPVDELVDGLVRYVDHSDQAPAKIIALTAAGICDDLTDDQAKQLYGNNFQDVLYAHQYAIKMIDELELPYTAVRVPKIVGDDVSAEVTTEGQPLAGLRVGQGQLASFLATVMTTDRYLNQSIGIGGK